VRSLFGHGEPPTNVGKNIRALGPGSVLPLLSPLHGSKMGRAIEASINAHLGIKFSRELADIQRPALYIRRHRNPARGGG
jgi:hypothetical protein